LFAGNGIRRTPEVSISTRTITATTVPIRKFFGRLAAKSPMVNTPNAVVSAPRKRPLTKGAGPIRRHTGADSTTAEFLLQADPESERPAAMPSTNQTPNEAKNVGRVDAAAAAKMPMAATAVVALRGSEMTDRYELAFTTNRSGKC
jgi:hypothetical protein